MLARHQIYRGTLHGSEFGAPIPQPISELRAAGRMRASAPTWFVQHAGAYNAGATPNLSRDTPWIRIRRPNPAADLGASRRRADEGIRPYVVRATRGCV